MMSCQVMTMSALKAYPKVYWIWNHWRWCLEGVFHGWAEKMLDVDPRNCESPSMSNLSIQLKMLCSLVAWYYILSGMLTPRPESSELLYTSKEIEANFSNFSVCHQRSKTLWAQGELNERYEPRNIASSITMTLLRDRLRITAQCYTDPNDQSVWYHR